MYSGIYSSPSPFPSSTALPHHTLPRRTSPFATLTPSHHHLLPPTGYPSSSPSFLTSPSPPSPLPPSSPTALPHHPTLAILPFSQLVHPRTTLPHHLHSFPRCFRAPCLRLYHLLLPFSSLLPLPP
ncbi:uncharacterized protein SCHCODRAFT_02441563, partial [Schizophyllum commune H4-8]|uniref:uncharacterized protein n=1 Tax=Schizophyllum commune (strain H4-8 / FGSC 9210) TaxID=578458 RepID=UPI00215EA840